MKAANDEPNGNEPDQPRHAFVVQYTKHEYEWLQARAGVAPDDRIPYEARNAMVAEMVAEARNHDIEVHFIQLTAQQVLDFMALTETRIEDCADLGAQLAIMIGVNRMKRGEIM